VQNYKLIFGLPNRGIYKFLGFTTGNKDKTDMCSTSKNDCLRRHVSTSNKRSSLWGYTTTNKKRLHRTGTTSFL